MPNLFAFVVVVVFFFIIVFCLGSHVFCGSRGIGSGFLLPPRRHQPRRIRRKDAGTHSSTFNIILPSRWALEMVGKGWGGWRECDVYMDIICVWCRIRLCVYVYMYAKRCNACNACKSVPAGVWCHTVHIVSSVVWHRPHAEM